MALSQSVASELLEAFRAGEGVDLVRESVPLVMQELIEVVGAGRYERDAVVRHGDDDLVAEHAGPLRERQVDGQDQRGVFVARGHELEEQVRGSAAAPADHGQPGCESR